MQNFLLSLFLGKLPDVLFSWVFITEIKETKTKRLIFFILGFVVYVFCITQIRYQLLLYLVLDVILFLIMKLLYKSNITDFFLIIVLDLYLFICSIISYMLIPNYYIALIVYRLILFLPLIFINKLRNIYKQYKTLWNRHNEKGKIKSITIRNIVIVLLHITILILHFALIYILSM